MICLYIAAMHSIRLLACALSVPVIVASIAGWRLWATGHPALAIIDTGIIAGLDVSIPLLASTCLGAIGFDLLGAELDPLTGLLNRRSFWDKTANLIASRPDRHNYLLIAIVDLDKFKAVNDTRGHAAGDRVLAAVARCLRLNAREGEVARLGGEEFAYALTVASADPGNLAAQMCHAIADLPEQVTASIGTASVCLDAAREDQYPVIIDDLVTRGDYAMYKAKQNGGNQARHHRHGDTLIWAEGRFSERRHS